MIEQADVITMRVPFPQIDSSLAVKAHMYICIKDGTSKKFVKSQTFKPFHLKQEREPYYYIIESSNIERNPFKKKTTIDCDKAFCLDGVIIDQSLLTDRRKNVCKDLFHDIQREIMHDSFKEKELDNAEFLSLNKNAKSTS